MLRRLRIILALIFFTGVTLLFLDFTGAIHAWLGWMAKIQFFPAILALNLGIVIALVLLTLIFGRIYCSVICPLGVMQDVAAWLGKKQKKNRYSYSPAKSWLRYGVLGLFIVALIAGVGSFVALLEPYSAYGRIASNLFAPVYGWVNNLFALIAEKAESYAFYRTDVWLKSLPTFIIAAVTLVTVFVLAWRNGRTWCNTICPVGTILSFLARFSWFRPVIDTDKCISCKKCERNCKASCIDISSHKIDYSRCVTCMDCIGNCPKDAISYRHPAKASGKGIRQGRAETGCGNGQGFRRGHITQGLSDSFPDDGRSGHCKGSGEEGGRRTCGHRGQGHTGQGYSDSASRSRQPQTFCPALYRMPALRVSVPQRGAPAGDRHAAPDAARDVLRKGILPSGVHQVLGGLPGRSHKAHRCS